MQEEYHYFLRTFHDLGVEAARSKIHGVGVLALRKFEKGKIIGVMSGRILEGMYDDEPSTDYTLGLEDERGSIWYLEPNEPFRYLNHSLNPNAELPNFSSPCIYALRDIHEGEEITIRYGPDWDDTP